ncbi:TetR/AcrR family transcriptional regulator [Nocardioides marmoribigeumensis]|nr:TetR/AcrR family transcriptional regulator [Nocardioides marmoribigeumensis]
MAGHSGKTDGRQSRWDEHNEARRTAVLDAAIAAIEAAPEGAEVPVADIAARAGLSRTVLYRHFDDRADLDKAIRGRIFEHLQGVLLPRVTLDGTPVEIIQRIVGAYVDWATAHPRLHHVVHQQPLGLPGSPTDQAIGQLARQIRDLIVLGTTVLAFEADDDVQAALDPLVFGFIGMVMAAVHRWLGRADPAPAAEAFTGLLSEAIWMQIHGMAAARGLELDADVPIEQLLAGALESPESEPALESTETP